MNLKNIPAELCNKSLWLQYYLKPDLKRPDKKPKKQPEVKWATPEARKENLRPLDYLISKRTLARNGGGYQRWIDPEESYTYVDIDHVRDPKTGEIAEWARTLIKELDTYCEISASGKGFHLVMRATLAKDFCLAHHQVEIYSGHINKLFGMTGDVYLDYVQLENRQSEAESLLRRAEAFDFKEAGAETAGHIEENAINPEDESLPEFPKLPGALGQLVEAITPDLPYDHKSLALITYIGLALAKRIELASDPWLQPRFYSCMVGPAFNGKTACDLEVRNALGCADGFVLGRIRVEFSMDSGPAQVEAFQENNIVILAPDELADQFEKARAGTTGRNSLFGEWLRLYESNQTGNFTRTRRNEGGRIEVHDARLAILGGATTERFETMWTGSGGAASGLQSRFVLSYSEKPIPRLKTPNNSEAIQQAREILTEVVNREPRRVCLSTEAQEALLDWRAFDDADPSMAEVMRRIVDMAKRFAMVVAACEGLTEIDVDTMHLALQFADYQIALREKLFPADSANNVQAFENRIMKFYDKHGHHSEAVLINALKPEKFKGGFTAYNAAFAALRHAAKLAQAGKSRKGQIVWELAR